MVPQLYRHKTCCPTHADLATLARSYPVDGRCLAISRGGGMRRSLVAAVFVLATVAFLAPPLLAQVPQPKVTITGLFDQITSAGRNFLDGNFSRDNDREWYARTRFRPDFEFAVGRTKAVLGLEMDLNYGQTGSNDGGFPG